MEPNHSLKSYKGTVNVQRTGDRFQDVLNSEEHKISLQALTLVDYFTGKERFRWKIWEPLSELGAGFAVRDCGNIYGLWWARSSEIPKSLWKDCVLCWWETHENKKWQLLWEKRTEYWWGTKQKLLERRLDVEVQFLIINRNSTKEGQGPSS